MLRVRELCCLISALLCSLRPADASYVRSLITNFNTTDHLHYGYYIPIRDPASGEVHTSFRFSNKLSEKDDYFVIQLLHGFLIGKRGNESSIEIYVNSEKVIALADGKKVIEKQKKPTIGQHVNYALVFGKNFTEMSFKYEDYLDSYIFEAYVDNLWHFLHGKNPLLLLAGCSTFRVPAYRYNFPTQPRLHELPPIGLPPRTVYVPLNTWSEFHQPSYITSVFEHSLPHPFEFDLKNTFFNRCATVIFTKHGLNLKSTIPKDSGDIYNFHFVGVEFCGEYYSMIARGEAIKNITRQSRTERISSGEAPQKLSIQLSMEDKLLYLKQRFDDDPTTTRQVFSFSEYLIDLETHKSNSLFVTVRGIAQWKILGKTSEQVSIENTVDDPADPDLEPNDPCWRTTTTTQRSTYPKPMAGGFMGPRLG